MKKKFFSKLLEWALTLSLLGLYAFMLVEVLTKTENLIFTIGLCVLGLIITVFLSSLAHEIGHLIFGIFAGLKLYSIMVLFIKLTFKKGKFPKIQFVLPIDFGSTDFLPKTREKYYKKICVSALGGLIFSALYLIMGVTFIYVGNYFTYLAFGITFPITAYIILVNLIPFDESSDGYLLFSAISGGQIKRIIDNCLTAIADITLGIQPKDLDSRLLAEFTKDCNAYSVRVIYLRYLAYFRRDRERAVKELISICDSQKLNEEFYILIFKELFYDALLKKDDDYIKANQEEAVNYLSYEMHASDYRIHATYRAYIGDKDWAKLIIKSGEENLENFIEKGIAIAEIDALNELKAQLN